MISYSPTPVQDISHHPRVAHSGVQLLLKREDLNHPQISGNKWWKLKYNLEEARRCRHDTILTFGGAFSNHIFATAAAAKGAGMKSIGIIRGEVIRPLNPTLQFAVDQGMTLDYVDRQTYRQKDDPSFLSELQSKWGAFYLIPEGGTNELAVRGCEEFGRLLDAIPSDYVCLPVGTGGTIAGIIRGISTDKSVIGITVVKNGAFLYDVIQSFLPSASLASWQLQTQYAYGGYAKRDANVMKEIEFFRTHLRIPLDFVYTGKLICATLDLIERGFFPKGKTVLVVHTGGLQGHSEGRITRP